MKKILILGSSGLLGSNLLRILKNKFNTSHNGIKKRNLDINNLSKLDLLIKKKEPDLIINCVAITNIDDAEKNKKKTYKINVQLVKNLILLQKKYKFWFIHFSTDSFYNSAGKNNENSKKYFFNYYSKTKYLSDKIAYKKALVLRTNFFGFSNRKNTFTNFIYKSFKSKKRFYLFNDIFFNAISLHTLSKIIKKIILNNWGQKGIFNLGSKGCISKYNFAILFAKYLKIYNDNYKIIESNKIVKITRSHNMCMNVKKFEKKFKITLPNIKDELINEAKKNYIK